ncbi:MAG: ribonuclease HI [Saprospiraceae bacterium]|jgi:ribonuclease HI
MKDTIPEIELYTDGGVDPNPGIGGIGVVLKFKEHCKEFFQGYELTTNNRMEILAVMFGLRQYLG